MTSYNPETNQIDHVRGDTLIATFSASGLAEGEAITSATFSIKKRATDTDYLVHVESTEPTAGGSSIAISGGNVVHIVVSAADQENMPSGSAVWDLQIGTNGELQNYTPLLGKINSTDDVSKNIQGEGA